MNLIKKIFNKIKNQFQFKKTKKIDIYKEKIKKNQKIKNIRSKNLQVNFNFKKTINKTNKIFIFYGLLIILIIISFVLKGDYFRISNIVISKNDPFINSKIIENKLNFLKGKLIFNIDKEEIEKKIKNIEENIKHVRIKTNFKNKINIILESYDIILRANIGTNNYYITENAVLIPFIKIKNQKLPIIQIKNIILPNYPLYKKILKEQKLKQILYIIKSIKDNIINLEIKNITYYHKQRELHIKINNNTIIIFDLQGDIKAKLKQLFVFNKEKKYIIKPGVIYIDNRILGKIYYCPLEEKYKCINNLNIIYDQTYKLSDFIEKNN